MTFMAALPLLLVATAVVVPLVREYLAFRREWGIGRIAALGTAFTLFPALGLGMAACQPLAAWPALQWVATVVVTILAYSLATAVLRPVVTPAEARAPRRAR